MLEVRYMITDCCIRHSRMLYNWGDWPPTNASIMLAAGVNLKAISWALGHANVSVTLGVYSHLMPGRVSLQRRSLTDCLNLA